VKERNDVYANAAGLHANEIIHITITSTQYLYSINQRTNFETLPYQNTVVPMASIERNLPFLNGYFKAH
jgi:hypothetical protein